MKNLTGQIDNHMTIEHLQTLKGEQAKNIEIKGIVHTINDMGKFCFLKLRCSFGFVQCVVDETLLKSCSESIKCECSVMIKGSIRAEERANYGFEIVADEIAVLSSPVEDLPVVINKYKYNASLETDLTYRHIGLRNAMRRAVFKLQDALVVAFREFLHNENFTEIYSPKIVSSGAEGGANIFTIEYFGKKAFLAQSPQFYKQMMIPVFERVCEIGPVFRAEKHDTARHLNEYISVDFEMAFIDSFYDICNMETAMIRYAFDFLNKNYASTLKTLSLTLPVITEIPCVKFKEAKERVAEKYGRRIKDPYDLEPEEERLISEMIKEETGSEFVFVTHYPVKKRPFYAMDDANDSKFTVSFDLLFRGMEITTGGQRIHDYNMQVEKMKSKGLDPADFESYLMLHKYGVPPHGGLGMGLERFCMKLLDESNIRWTSLFPRDTTRLDP